MKKISLKFIIVCVCFLVHNNTLFSQIKTYQFEQVDSLQKNEKKIVAVFIHTDWCKYCQAMQNTTFKNDSIIKLLNDKFYFIELNAEEKRSIVFNNYTFKFKPTGTNTGTNELANLLANFKNKISYPTLCFLNKDYDIIYQFPQYMHHTDLKAILQAIN